MNDSNNRLEQKRHIFQALLEKKRSEFDELRNFQRDQLESINKDDLDKGDMIESPTENLMREVRLEGKSLQNLEEEINILSKYNSPDLKDKVAPMSVIHTDIGNFVVGVPEHFFEVQGEKYTGISSQSPIYEAMENSGKGDEITFNGRQVRILDVF